jgi:hypothetical protein
MIDLEVMYLENKLMKANGIMTGIPPDKKTPIKMMRLK